MATTRLAIPVARFRFASVPSAIRAPCRRLSPNGATHGGTRLVEGHLVSGYADGGDAPDKQLSLVPGATQEAEAFLIAPAPSHGRFDRVVRLVEGFETPFGLELLATVHWVVTEEGAITEESMVQAVYDWASHKRRFSPDQVACAAERLGSEGGIPISAEPRRIGRRDGLESALDGRWCTFGAIDPLHGAASGPRSGRLISAERGPDGSRPEPPLARARPDGRMAARPRRDEERTNDRLQRRGLGKNAR